MMPIKIEILENKGSYDVVILGIGDIGKKAICKYPFPAYGENHWAIQTLTLCDDDAFRHQRKPGVTKLPDDLPSYLEECGQKILEVVSDAEILFIFADISKDSDYENAFRFAKLHKSNRNERKISILVNYGSEDAFSDVPLLTVFNAIISTRDAAQMYRPAEMLLTDMYTQWIGMDVNDVFSILKHTPSFEFQELHGKNHAEMLRLTKQLSKKLETANCDNTRTNCIMYVSLPETTGLDTVVEITDAFKQYHDMSVLFQMGYNRCSDDHTITVSLLYGTAREES